MGARIQLAIGSSRSHCRLEDDPTSFDPPEGVVAELHRRHPGRRFGKTGLVFDALTVAICGQKVTGTEAARAIYGLIRVFGDPAPGPNERLRLPPDPERMAAAPYYEYHTCISRSDEQTCSVKWHAKGQRSMPFGTHRRVMPPPPSSRSEASHGGPRRARSMSPMVIPIRWPWATSHIKHTVVHHLTGKDRGTDEEMLELLEPFRPQRGRAVRLLHLMGHEPKFGPRSVPRGHHENVTSEPSRLHSMAP